MASQGALGIGKLFGISIELHWIFVIMMLFFFILSPYLGFLWVLLFICVLIHELAHSVTAIKNGIRVSRILLLPFGGVSVIENVKLDPRIEFNVSLVGPLMSLLLGGIFGILAVVFPPGIVQNIVQWLFVINIFLGVFNIVPAFPMDGGRIFRSYLQRKRSLYDATMITAKVSRAVLYAFVVGNIAFLITGFGYPLLYREYVVLIDVIIVFFIYGGLKAEEENVTIRKETVGLTVGDAVSRHYKLVDQDAKVADLYELVKSSGEHLLITKKSDSYAIIDLRSMRGMSAGRTIGDAAVVIPKIAAKSSVADAMGILGGSELGVVAVEKDGKLFGIVTLSQLQTLVALHRLGNGPRA